MGQSATATAPLRFAAAGPAAAGGGLRRRAPDLRRRAAVAGGGRRRCWGVCRALAAAVPEWRRGPVRHALATLVPAAGVPDRLRLRGPERRRRRCAATRCSSWSAGGCRRPGRTWPASRPSRGWRTRCGRRSCYRLAVALGERLPAGAGARAGCRPGCCSTWTAPTTRPTGSRKGPPTTATSGSTCTTPCSSSTARPTSSSPPSCARATPTAARGAVAVLKRLVVRALRARWPGVADRAARRQRLRRARALRLLRGRRASPTPSGWCPTRAWRRSPPPCWPRRRRSRPRRGAKVRLAGETALPGRHLAARRGGWSSRPRPWPRGPTPASSSPPAPDPPLALYDCYVDRGEPENWIKDLKRACFADRLTCHRFLANQFRLLPPRRRLLAARHPAPLAGRRRGRAPPARHPPPAPAQDRRPGPRAAHPRPAAPRQQPPRPAALGPPRRPPRPAVNTPG